MSFTGFTAAALDFYEDLEVDNSKTFWEAHKDTYRTAVREPMEELVSELAEEFGAAKVFRPYRDVRFSANTPSVARTSPANRRRAESRTRRD